MASMLPSVSPNSIPHFSMKPLVHIWLAVHVAVAALVAQGAPPKSGAITGTVVDSETGLPLTEATVTIRGDQRTRISRQITDARGRFLFTELPPFDGYLITATRPGYLDVEASGEVIGGSLPQRVVLSAGELREVRIALDPAGAVGGVVQNELHEPVQSVQVSLFESVYVAGTSRWIPAGRQATDDRGRFRFGGLRSGKYTVFVPSVQRTVPDNVPATAGLPPVGVAATASLNQRLASTSGVDLPGGHRLLIGSYPVPPPSPSGRLIYPGTFWPSVREIRDAGAIELARGNKREDLQLVLRPEAAVRVRGKLAGPDAASLAGLTVRLLMTEFDELGPDSEVATSIVAADGSFLFPLVPAGRYSAIVRGTVAEYGATSPEFWDKPITSAPGMMVARRAEVRTTIPGMSLLTRSVYGSDSLWARGQITVDPRRDDEAFTLEVLPTAVVSGQIVWDRTSPSVRTVPPRLLLAPADGNPGRAVPPLSLQPRENTTIGFSVAGALTGDYFLRVEASGWVVKSILWNGVDYSDRPFALGPGATPSNVVVTLTDRYSSLTGTVVAANGPVGPAAVIAFPEEQDLWRSNSQNPRRIAVSMLRTDGRFHFAALPPGRYWVIATAPDVARAWSDPAFLARASTRAERVTIVEGQETTIKMRLSDIR